ncbi:MAG: hypothetical protein AAF731_07695 [Bacteroidota bacterium]
MATTSIRAALNPEQVRQRLSIKMMISEKTGIPIGRINDNVFYNVATDVLHELMSNGKKEELLDKFRQAYTD